jgi:predicted Zn-dependent protease
MRIFLSYCRFLRAASLMAAALAVPFTATAGLIRDAEIEATLAAYSRPIFYAAGIPPESVKLFVVDSPQINAFVAGGLNLFLNTGLIRVAKKPGMLIGVIAHETGHIAGAHLSQLGEKSTRATIGSLIGTAIGVIAVAGGAGNAGAGIIVGSQDMATRQLNGEIRAAESAADQAALTYLDASDISATGALEMFETLRRMESGSTKRDLFLSTHPLTTERITAMRNHIAESSIPADQVPEEFNAMHARMIAKLVAFREPYQTTLALYPLTDTSVAARYARAIAEFRRSNLAAALKGMDSLTKEYPKDAYFQDTRGQMLFENGKLKEAMAAYAKAAALAADSPLILTDYAKTIIALDKASELPHALLLLERARDMDNTNAGTWRQFAIAYSKQGKQAHSYHALAEEAALAGDAKTVLKHAARARAAGDMDASLTYALDDLEREAKEQRKKNAL